MGGVDEPPTTDKQMAQQAKKEDAGAHGQAGDDVPFGGGCSG
jgi:hypothetical protein